ncbi:MAG: 2-oxoacid:ferredoxin oxidoreductase subunit gamma [Methanomassiliicoccales archaeon]|nr:MAG: 2-oxoacid:ferredoxin oxidoreductase subunit gamma [Methanomassiliicoccales archaeon]
MNVRFCGFGGQGIVMAGYITGSAAVRDGKKATQTQSYGSESRGGACKSDVAISEEEIYELESEEVDLLVAMSQQAYERYIKTLRKGGILAFDEDLVTPKKTAHKLYKIKATDLAHKKFGREIVANMIMLGYITSISGFVSKDSMIQTILDNVPKGTEKMNEDAFELGHRLGSKVK